MTFKEFLKETDEKEIEKYVGTSKDKQELLQLVKDFLADKGNESFIGRLKRKHGEDIEAFYQDIIDLV